AALVGVGATCAVEVNCDDDEKQRIEGQPAPFEDVRGARNEHVGNRQQARQEKAYGLGKARGFGCELREECGGEVGEERKYGREDDGRAEHEKRLAEKLNISAVATICDRECLLYS